MDACKDSGVFHFVQRVGKTPERACDADQEIVVHGEMRPFAEEACEHDRGCAADGRVARRVFRVRWRRKERHPRRIRVGGRVAVGSGQGDCGDRAPEDVMIFRLPACDCGVRHREIEQREQSSILQQ